jgi:hypothetical protein
MKTKRIKAKRIKSNDRMPPRSAALVEAFLDEIRSWPSPHKKAALAFASKVGPARLFELLHAIRRWYSGQTMARLIHSGRAHLGEVMALAPRDAVGAYRGFKVDKGHPLASRSPGDRVTIPVTRNHGFSSWSTSESLTNRFSGGGKGKVGLIVKLTSPQWVTPVIAPPERTKEWFNQLYRLIIGDSFRPTEGEYLIHAPKYCAEIVRVKK